MIHRILSFHYRSRQYYESKVLHNTERFTIPLKLVVLIKTAKGSHSAIHNASFGTLKAKMGRLYSSQSIGISLKIVILVNSEAKWSNFRFLKKL